MNAIRSNNVILKYQRSTTLGCKDIEIRKSEFVAKSQFKIPAFKKSKKIVKLIKLKLMS